jgi:hypothetical protein
MRATVGKPSPEGDHNVSTPYESATLLIRLYELRRETAMREARTWYARSFAPTSADDVVATVQGPNSAHFRMVTSYWEMAASMANHGAIDMEMFNEANGEHLVIFAKIQPFLADYRAKMGSPKYLTALETLITSNPDLAGRLPAIRARFVLAQPAK